jgi:hypothetical protein
MNFFFVTHLLLQDIIRRRWFDLVLVWCYETFYYSSVTSSDDGWRNIGVVSIASSHAVLFPLIWWTVYEEGFMDRYGDDIFFTQRQVVACVVTRGGCNQCTLEIKLNTLCMLYQDKTNHSWVHRYGPRAVGSLFVEKTRKCYLKVSVFFCRYIQMLSRAFNFFWTVLLSNNFFTGSTYFQVHYWYSFRFSLFSSMFPFLLYYVIML